MAFDPSFLRLMATTAQYVPNTGTTGYGDPITGPAVNFVCHVSYKRRIIRDDTGQDRESNAVVQMPPPGYVVNGVATPTVTIYDQIVLLFDGVTRKIITVQTFTDDTGVHHQSLYLE